MVRVIQYEPVIKRQKVKNEIVSTIEKKEGKEVQKVTLSDGVFKNIVNAGDSFIIGKKAYYKIDTAFYEEQAENLNGELIDELNSLKKDEIVEKCKKEGVTIDTQHSKDTIINEYVKAKGVNVHIPRIEDYKY